jgi:hypothetical protein
MLADVVDGAFLGGSHPVLDLCKGLLDRIEVGRIRRQIPEPCAGGVDETAQRGRFVAAEIVHNDDVARLERRQKDLLDISAEAFAVDRPIEQAGRGEAVAAQRAEEGQRAPAAMRRKASYPFASCAPSPQRSHIGLDPGLIDEDEAGRVKAGLPRSPALPTACDVGTALLKCEQRFF